MANNRMEKLFWSLALPGFGQFLNKHYIKGVTLLLLEFIVNKESNLNKVIILSFKGNIQSAVAQTNYQWLMFYPCLYMFGMWDAYKYGGDDLPRNSYLPFVFGAFFATVGVIYSDSLRIIGVLFGPVWLAILFCFLGILFGYLLKILTRLNLFAK